MCIEDFRIVVYQAICVQYAQCSFSVHLRPNKQAGHYFQNRIPTYPITASISYDLRIHPDLTMQRIRKLISVPWLTDITDIPTQVPSSACYQPTYGYIIPPYDDATNTVYSHFTIPMLTQLIIYCQNSIFIH